MTGQRFDHIRNWIRTELVEQASQRFANQKELQLVYQIGFLEAQLAQAIADDNKYLYRFKQAIEQADTKLRRL